MRKAGLPGYAIGAHTAQYYWPSAMIREYAAILRDHRGLTVTAVGLLSIPLAAQFVFWMIATLFG